MNLSSTLKRLVILLVVATGIVSCAGEPEKPEYVERPVEPIYNEALKRLSAGQHLQAAYMFDEVERQHPYSVWARRAMIMSAYAYYESNKYDEAINAADRFIALHPGNKDIAYAYYLKAICNYERITDVGRDQQMTLDTYDALNEVIRRFPESEYARDARLKLDMTRDHLAGKEMSVGRFYLRQHNYIAALNRFRVVVQEYQTTTHVAEALHRLTEVYLAMGIDMEARTSAAVLGYNYPGSDWYQDSYRMLKSKDLAPEENKESWISRSMKNIF